MAAVMSRFIDTYHKSYEVIDSLGEWGGAVKRRETIRRTDQHERGHGTLKVAKQRYDRYAKSNMGTRIRNLFLKLVSVDVSTRKHGCQVIKSDRRCRQIGRDGFIAILDRLQNFFPQPSVLNEWQDNL